MRTSSSNDNEIRISGPDHPITISPAVGKVRVTVLRSLVLAFGRLKIIPR